MRLLQSTISLIFCTALFACTNSNVSNNSKAKRLTPKVYAKEPNDSADYKFIKCDFYLSKDGHLCERKIAIARDTTCNCDFVVYYDSTFSIYKGNETIEKPLNSIIDINSFVSLDSTEPKFDKELQSLDNFIGIVIEKPIFIS